MSFLIAVHAQLWVTLITARFSCVGLVDHTVHYPPAVGRHSCRFQSLADSDCAVCASPCVSLGRIRESTCQLPSMSSPPQDAARCLLVPAAQRSKGMVLRKAKCSCVCGVLLFMIFLSSEAPVCACVCVHIRTHTGMHRLSENNRISSRGDSTLSWGKAGGRQPVNVYPSVLLTFELCSIL